MNDDKGASNWILDPFEELKNQTSKDDSGEILRAVRKVVILTDTEAATEAATFKSPDRFEGTVEYRLTAVAKLAFLAGKRDAISAVLNVLPPEEMHFRTEQSVQLPLFDK